MVPNLNHSAFLSSSSISLRCYRKNFQFSPTPTVCSAARDLYNDLGIRDGNSTTPLTELKSAYRSLVVQYHPDSTEGDNSAANAIFTAASEAWAILGDPQKRAAYDAMGYDGITAIASIEERSAKARALGLDLMDTLDTESLASDGTLDFSLLSPATIASEVKPPAEFDEHDDACPRSIDEALWNIAYHDDQPTRYYTLWWVYRFRVVQAEYALVNLLRNRNEPSSLKRRAALALGVVASENNTNALTALIEMLDDHDYYLRYRAAEAIAAIARRHRRNCNYPPLVLQRLSSLLKAGAERMEHDRLSKSGYEHQESLFDLDSLQPEVRDKLQAIFEARRENESRSRRTASMTPNLDVDAVDSQVDQPYEWLLKAAGTIAQFGNEKQKIVDIVCAFATHEIPLVRYAARKALYMLTGDKLHAEEMLGALDYAVEHHYSQRVVIRDLGDVGYAAGAKAIAECPMVENSFKVIALKNMLSQLRNDPNDADVRNVLKYMDSLL